MLVDASEMTKGQLEIDSDLPVRQYDKIGPNIYQVTIVPKKVGKHDLVIKYNEQVVDGKWLKSPSVAMTTVQLESTCTEIKAYIDFDRSFLYTLYSALHSI